MLTKKKQPFISTTLAVTGQGETIKFNVTYRNQHQDDLAERVDIEADPKMSVAKIVLDMVTEWETEYPLTVEGVQEMERDRPGLIMAVILGFHKARQVELEKN